MLSTESKAHYDATL